MHPSHLPTCPHEQTGPVCTWKHTENAVLRVVGASSVSRTLNNNRLLKCRGWGGICKHLLIISKGLKSEPQREMGTSGAGWWQQVQPLQNSSGGLALNREEPWPHPIETCMAHIMPPRMLRVPGDQKAHTRSQQCQPVVDTQTTAGTSYWLDLARFTADSCKGSADRSYNVARRTQ